MEPVHLITTAQLTGALVLTYEEAVAAYVTWRRASIAGTRYRRRALAAFCDTDPTVVGFCAVTSSLAAAAVQIRETYDAGFAGLGEHFARGNASSADALRDQLLTLTHTMSGLNTACSSPRPGTLNLSHVIHASESVRVSAVRTLSALYRRLALKSPSPQVPAELAIPKARAPNMRSDLLYRPQSLDETPITQITRPAQSSRHSRDRTPTPSNSNSNSNSHPNHHVPMPAVARKPAPSTSNSVATSIHTQPPHSNRFTVMTPTSPVFQGIPTLQTITPRRKPVPVPVPESRPEPKPESSHRRSHVPSDNRSSMCFNSNPPSPPLTPEHDPLHHSRSCRKKQGDSDSDSDSDYEQDYDDYEQGGEDEYHRHHAHAYEHDNRDYLGGTDEMGHWTEMGVAVAIPITVNNSVFSTFCPQAMALQVDGSSPMPGTAACATCGYRWRGTAGSKPVVLKDGFRVTERFLAKSHCRLRAGDPERRVQFGCVLCTSRGKTARYPTSAALAVHINEDHSKWQMLHDRDMT